MTIHLIAPRDKVVPWLMKQQARWEAIGAMPIENEADTLDVSRASGAAQSLLFQGFKRGFTTTEMDELNTNRAGQLAAVLAVGSDLDVHRSQRDIAVRLMLRLIGDALAACEAGPMGYDPPSPWLG
jgi:hypothetical protein